MTLLKAKHIHVIGIGGIGVSAIAKLLVRRGHGVTGSDVNDSEIVREAAAAGIKTVVGHRAENLGAAEVVIYSEAVPRDNPERAAARERDLPEYSGAEALAELTKGQRLIAVAGTNGKSTTTALLGLLLEAGGFDPTVIVGSKVPSFEQGNLRVGQSDWWVLEADEYQAKFLHLHPEMAIVTNIEEDHLDFFRDLAHIQETFQKFLDQSGQVILNVDDRSCANDLSCAAAVTYGIKNKARYEARDLEIVDGTHGFTLMRDDEKIGRFALGIPGRFNLMNALAALTAALELGVKAAVAKKVLASFKGIWRRFEKVGEKNGAVIISDYGHHPTSIRGTLEAAREFYPGRRVVLVFQPHHHHRTKAFFHRFVDAFSGADVLILPEVYTVPGRDEGGEVGSENLVKSALASEKISEVHFGGTLEKTEKLVRKLMKPGDVILVMGAGDVDRVARNLINK